MVRETQNVVVLLATGEAVVKFPPSCRRGPSAAGSIKGIRTKDREIASSVSVRDERALEVNEQDPL